MSLIPTTLERLEHGSAQLLDRLAARPRLAAAALLALALFTYLPGVFLLPPVDRTEIVYAQSSRGMLQFFEKLEDQISLNTVRQDPYLQTHPLTQDRVASVQQHVDHSPYSDAPDPAAFQEMHARMLAKL